MTLLVLAAALVLAACSRGGGGMPTGPALEGTRWVLLPESLGVPVPAGNDITATFGDGGVRGSAGCNAYSATVERPGGGALRVGPVSSTDRACRAEVMTAEQTYLDRLAAVRTFHLGQDELTLGAERGPALLRFRAQPAGPPVGPWQVTGFRDAAAGALVAPLPGTSISLGFGADGLVDGQACNHYGGPWRTDGAAVTVGPLQATDLYCTTPPGATEQGSSYVAALQSAATWKVEAGTLTLTDGEGRTAVTATAVVLAVAAGVAGG